MTSGQRVKNGLAETQQAPLIPFAFARLHGVLLDPDALELRLLHRPGLSSAVVAELQRVLGLALNFEEVPAEVFRRQLSQNYQGERRGAEEVAEGLGSEVNLSRLAEEIPDAADLVEAEDDAPVIQLINALISQAVREQASDIHIETYEDKLSVRFRIDGVLSEVLNSKRQLAPMLVSRIKVMARLDIAEKRQPQDGRISVRLAGHGVDIRVSTLPAAHGERVVMRLLDKQAGKLELSQLQMHERVKEAYARALRLPHGIILVTGPTGSGKTTTLYAGLMHINDAEKNILTIEDPIEYSLPGIGQTQVNTKVNMNFANGLRSILRQDPDVVMLGEIRDAESAKIAVQASLTGHLVLSTLHTNTAIGAVTRLQDMGVEPFLLASSLSALISQRLVRLLCRDCRETYRADDQECEFLGLEAPQTLYRAVGCPSCKHSGYQHRSGIFEFIEVDDVLRRLIHENAGEDAMLQHVRDKWPSINEDGRRLILAGETTLEEVLRVTAA